MPDGVSRTGRVLPVERNGINSLIGRSGESACSPAYAGTHLIVDFWSAKHLSDIQQIKDALIQAASEAGAVLLHTYVHRFSGAGGVTGVALLAESHISVHTWPEYEYAAFDIFMCSGANPAVALEVLRSVFEPADEQVRKIVRGGSKPVR